MWLSRFTNYLLSHFWLAVILTFLVTFVPIIGMVSILFAALVTLHTSIRQGAILTIAATLPYVTSSYFSGQHEGTIPIVVWAAVGVAVCSNLLTWVFARSEEHTSELQSLAYLLFRLLL